MAIDKSAPNYWTDGLIDKIAELVGKEFIPIFEEDCYKFSKNGCGYIDEEWLIEQAIERVTGKIRLIMGDDVLDKIWCHPTLDEYIKELEEVVYEGKPKYPIEPELPYRTDAQRLAEVGMSMRDFI